MFTSSLRPRSSRCEAQLQRCATKAAISEGLRVRLACVNRDRLLECDDRDDRSIGCKLRPGTSFWKNDTPRMTCRKRSKVCTSCFASPCELSVHTVKCSLVSSRQASGPSLGAHPLTAPLHTPRDLPPRGPTTDERHAHASSIVGSASRRARCLSHIATTSERKSRDRPLERDDRDDRSIRCKRPRRAASRRCGPDDAMIGRRETREESRDIARGATLRACPSSLAGLAHSGRPALLRAQ